MAGRSEAGPMRRGVTAAAALLLGGGLAWAIAGHGLSDEAARRHRGEQAFALAPGSVAAAVAASEARLAAADADGAAAAGRAAVVASPLSAAGLRSLATSRLASQPDVAARMLSAAAGLGWRDGATQAWLAAAAAAAGDLPGAARALDALARVRGPTPAIAGSIDTLAASPAGRAALAERLAERPAWRLAYLGTPAVAPAALGARAALLAALGNTPAPPTRIEAGRVARALVATGDVPAAWRLWRMVDPGDATPDDGGFTQVAPSWDASPFEWRLAPPPGVSADTGGGGLHVGSDGSAAGPIVSQTLMLAPGAYRIETTVRFEGPGARDAFRWTIACPPGGPRIALPPAPADGDRLVQPFAVPAGCPHQTLALTALPVGSDGVRADIRAVAIR